MSHYIKQEHDFVERTIRILEQYEKLDLPKNDKYEVTLLIPDSAELLSVRILGKVVKK